METKKKKGERVDMCKAWDDQLEYGKQIGKTEGVKEGLVLSVCNLMETMHFSMEKAMDMLKVPVEQQVDIAEMIQSA